MLWFKKKYTLTNGALPDTRPQEEQAKDYKQEEIVTAPAPVTWVKKTTYRSFPKRMQDGSGSCVMQGLEKERGIMAYLKYGVFIFFSSIPGYQLRANPSISGSTKLDRIKAANFGSVHETLLPSQSMTDEQMMAVKQPTYIPDVAKIFGCKAVDLPIDIDTIASTIQVTGKGVAVWFRFGPGEWFHKLIVVISNILGINLPWGHAVVAVDYTLGDDGKKYLVIEDSACEDGYPQRLVSEDFLLKRCFVCSYLVNFNTYTELPSKPKFDGSIKSLQDILKYEGLFPANQDSTGVFGPITTKGLIEFQKRYNITPALGNLGPITLAKLSEVYN